MPEKKAANIILMQRHRLLSLQISALLVVSACGGPESPAPESGAEPSATSTTSTAESSPARTNVGGQETGSVVNSLTFEATGDSTSTLESDGSDLMLTGGCLDQNAIGMSFTRGQITASDLFQVRLRTADSVGAGETGTFPLSELGWYDGQVKPENLPAETNILVPNAYTGSGTLLLTRHDGGGLNGRMVGTVEGTVKQSGGDKEAVIKASFDINLGCTTISLDRLN